MKFRSYFLVLFLSLVMQACTERFVDKRISYLAENLGSKFDSIAHSNVEQTFIFAGNKGCNSCVNYSLDKIYNYSVAAHPRAIFFVLPSDYLATQKSIPDGVFIDSIRLVERSTFLSYITIISVKSQQIKYIKDIEYHELDSMLSTLK